MNEPFMGLLYMLAGGMAAVMIMLLIRERSAAPEATKPEPTILDTPCPWCGGALHYYKPGFYHFALCESDECGFASKTATASAMAHDIASQRGKAPNPAISGERNAV